MRARSAILVAGAVAALGIYGMSRPELMSGLQQGAETIPFHPTHVTGADSGSQTCPV